MTSGSDLRFLESNSSGGTLIEVKNPSESIPNKYGLLLPVDLVPDYNRDGMINDEDRGKVTEETPFFFWVNNDDDGNSDPEMQDTPGANVDNGDMEVNTVRDLVDFFPVQLRIQELLEVLPPAEHSYKISDPDGAFHFIEMPDIHPDSQSLGAGSYLRNSGVAEEAVAGSISGEMKATAGEGAELSAGFLAACLEGRGILLFEAVAETQNSFELVVSKKNGGGEVARIRRALPVEIVTNPEAYYWRLNLRPAADGQNVGDAEPPANAKFRDSRKDRWFVFVHGYNVNFDQYRARNAEVFKRLYQMGNDSKYVAVSWTGDVSQIGGGDAVISPDYWRNVYNAFATSSPLAHKLNGLTATPESPNGSKDKTVTAAHSLGNMMVSSAICDHGLLAEKYFMMNSAVAKEAYIPSIITMERNVMSHPDWRSDPVYPDKLWASNWYDLFTDARRNMTWQGRFENLKNITSPWNYYSTGETTAATNDGSLPLGELVNGKRAWVAQEMFKGSTLQGIVSGWYKGAWDSHGGWAFNLNAYTEYRPNPLNPPSEPNDTSEIPNAALKSISFFDPWTILKMENGGASPDSNGTPVTDPNQGAAAHAAEYSVRAWMLAYEIPALSNPTASGPLRIPGGVEYGGSTDMNDRLRSGVWGDWQHGGYLNDMDHVWKLYDDWTTKGNLKK
jgi:hypothetical protein